MSNPDADPQAADGGRQPSIGERDVGERGKTVPRGRYPRGTMQHEVCSRAGTQARWHAPRAVAAPPVRDAPASCGNVRRAALGRPDMDSGGLYSGLWPSPVLEPAPNPPDDGAEPEGVPPDDAGWPAIEAAVTPPLRLAMNAFTSAARC